MSYSNNIIALSPVLENSRGITNIHHNERKNDSHILNQLSLDCLTRIITFLGRHQDIVNLSLVNQTFQSLCTNNSVYDFILERYFPHSYAYFKRKDPKYADKSAFFYNQLRIQRHHIKDEKYKVFTFKEEECKDVIPNPSISFISPSPTFDQVIVMNRRDESKTMIEIHNFKKGEKIQEWVLQKNLASNDRIFSIIDNDSMIAASVSSALRKEKIKIWDRYNGQHRMLVVGDSIFHKVIHAQTGEKKQGTVSCLCMTKDNKKIISGSTDDTIKIWDVDSGERLQTLKGHKGKVTDVTVYHDKWIVSSSVEGTIKVWDIDSGEMIQTLKEDKSVIKVAVYNNEWIISCLSNGKVRIWDLKTGKQLESLETIDKDRSYAKDLGSHPSEKEYTFIIRDHFLIFISYRNNEMTIWDLDNQKKLVTLNEDPRNKIDSVGFYNGQLISTYQNSSIVKVYDFNYGPLSTYSEQTL